MKKRNEMKKKEGRKKRKYFIVFMQSFGLADLRSTGPTPKRLQSSAIYMYTK